MSTGTNYHQRSFRFGETKECCSPIVHEQPVQSSLADFDGGKNPEKSMENTHAPGKIGSANMVNDSYKWDFLISSSVI